MDKLEKRILSRLDDKMYNAVNKKLALKKYASYDLSKFIRAAIDSFIDQGLFEYISNTNAIINILNDNINDLNGIHGNITQITDHLKDFENDKNIKLLSSNYKKISAQAKQNVLKMKDLIRLLEPFEKQYKKENVVMTRIDLNNYELVKNKIDEYINIKLDMSKFIRAAIKYSLNSKYYKLSDNQISLARELISNSNSIQENTETLNKYALYLNIDKNVDIEDLIELRKNLTISLNDNKEIVNKLYIESNKTL